MRSTGETQLLSPLYSVLIIPRHLVLNFGNVASLDYDMWYVDMSL